MTYDKFFKEAQKARGLIQGEKSKKATKPNSPRQLSRTPPRTSVETPEQRVRAELAARMMKRRSAQHKKQRKVPVVASTFLAVSLLGGVVGYYKSDVLDQWLAKVEIRVLGQALAEAEGGEKSSTPSAVKKEKTAEAKAAAPASEAPNVKQWSSEELSSFSKLNDRKKELDLREADLNKLEEELQKRQAELDEKIKQLESMRAEISKTLKTRVAADKEKVDKLVDFYSTMKPATAAKVIETLNEDLAVEVLDHMKKKNAAEIMDMMNPKKARRLSELLTGYERTTASVADEGEPTSEPKESAPSTEKTSDKSPK